ncbi:nuclear transport factor 2 family protein [Zavarzinia sp. CC-PAN008]|uniref:nuclear transport factor 2 family protein n=1 Tax=Zavarzinia sp. CC-PAN008 TaxID=3243332 RepID=UPI003F74A06A
MRDKPAMAPTPLDVTQAIFERFGAQDVDGIVALLHNAVVIDFYGPAVIPYAGHYEGLAQARRFFETVLASVDIHQFDADEFICAGDKVVVTGRLRLTARSTGREIRSDFVHVITVADARWLHFRDFMNTAVAEAAFRAS